MKIKSIIFAGYIFMMCLSLQAQNDQNTERSVSGNKNPLSDYREQIYLHVNTSFLLTGESIYFKAYCLESKSLQPSSISEIAYVDLIDSDGGSVLKSKIKLDNGTGYGDFFIPSTIRSGDYTLIAYTNWMKNADKSSFFRTPVYIINPFIRLSQEDSVATEPSIEIFPEGGNLLAGMSNTMAVRLRGFPGGSTGLKGKLVDDQGNTISDFTTSADGIGRLSFQGNAGNSYKLIVTDNNDNFHFKDLPELSSEGFKMEMKTGLTSFKLNVSNNGEAYYYNQAKLMIHTASSEIKSCPLKFQEKSTKMELEKNSLPAGVIYFSVMDVEGELVAQRAVYNDKITGLSPGIIEVNLNKNKFAKRSEVILSLNGDQALQASVSVRKAEPLVQGPGHTALSYNLLDNPSGAYVSKSISYLEKEEGYDIDNLMLTLNSDAKSLELNKNKEIKFLPDVRGDLITGKLLDRVSGEPMVKEKVYLSIPSKSYKFYASVTDEDGRFYFNVKDFTGEQNVIIQADSAQDYRVEMDEEFVANYTDLPLTGSFDIGPEFKDLIKERSIHTQIENAYFQAKQDSVLKQDELNFYGNPDVAYLLDEYTRFPTMEDVLREFVPQVIVRKRKDQYILKVIDFTKSNNLFQELPLILIDGVPVFDANVLMSYNPLNIEKLELKCRRYFYGPLNNPGILSFETYNGDLPSFELNNLAFQKEMSGIQPKKMYFAPDYSDNRSASVPDYRHQLYWNPDITLEEGANKSLSFFTSDVEGNYEVTVEGVSTDGQPFSKKIYFEVGANLP